VTGGDGVGHCFGLGFLGVPADGDVSILHATGTSFLLMPNWLTTFLFWPTNRFCALDAFCRETGSGKRRPKKHFRKGLFQIGNLDRWKQNVCATCD